MRIRSTARPTARDRRRAIAQQRGSAFHRAPGAPAPTRPFAAPVPRPRLNLLLRRAPTSLHAARPTHEPPTRKATESRFQRCFRLRSDSATGIVKSHDLAFFALRTLSGFERRGSHRGRGLRIELGGRSAGDAASTTRRATFHLVVTTMTTMFSAKAAPEKRARRIRRAAERAADGRRRHGPGARARRLHRDDERSACERGVAGRSRDIGSIPAGPSTGASFTASGTGGPGTIPASLNGQVASPGDAGQR